MKSLLLLLVLTSLLGTCSGIKSGVPGSGNIQSQRRDVAAFDSIATEGAFEIEVVCQKTQSVEIVGDDNILPFVATEVSNNVLHVKSLSSYSVSKPIVLKIALPDLRRINTAGAGSIEVTGMKNDEFGIEANGAASIRAAGETKSLNINVSGASKIDTHRLRAGRVVVDSKGVSKVEVNASDQLDVIVSGPSSVVYQGNPVVNKTINGPGSVSKRESEGS